jgi:uncharacterized SAM-binding protein YcdF (DUF218 family)
MGPAATASMRAVRCAGRVLAGFIVLNALGEILRPGFALNHFWTLSSQLLGPLRHVLTPLLAAALLLPDRLLARDRRLRRAAVGICALFAALSVLDAGRFWWLLARGQIRTPSVVPFSVLIGGVLWLSALRIARPRDVPGAVPRGGAARACLGEVCTCGVLGLGGVLAFIFTYGPTDYSAPADCAVVLGSRAYRDGSPSLALYDRTMTAVDLYRRGLVGKLVMSGGIDRYADGTRVSEPQVCRRLALEAGVPDADIVLDEAGVDSWATVRNTRRLAGSRGWRRVLLVSHYYHLPRLRLAADRAGLDGARTVPARQTRRLRKEPWGVARECAGLAYYYLFRLPAAEG